MSHLKGFIIKSTLLAIVAMCLMQVSFADPLLEEKVDTAVVSKIRTEELEHSQVMDVLSWLTDVNGPRLTGSPGHVHAAEWVKNKLTSWGIENARLEAWGPFGKGWTLKSYSANVTEPAPFPLISYPKAWSPGTGSASGEVIYFSPETDSALETFRGKLKGKFLMINDARVLQPLFKPRATRSTEQELLDLANSDFPRRRDFLREGRTERTTEQRRAAMVDYLAMEMARQEGALALLTASRGDGGNIFVMGASIFSHPDSPFTRRVRVHDNKAPKILPQIAVGSEHYNRLYRILQKGVKVKMNMDLDTEFNKADSSYNVIAEIPGTDLKDEIVMVGGHLDSWHGGTGATDDGTGVATCMEAMRIIKALGLKPRRTIRIALWSGEEQGTLGSREYVKRHVGVKETIEGVDKVTLTSEGERLSIYINNDNGTGKIRGVYMQGNEKVRNIFRAWLKPFETDGAATLTLSNTGSTDHVPFDAVGIPAFQFIQDEIEYFPLTWHSTMDLYDRVIEEDLRQTATIMASFLYNAAMRDEKIPRK